LVKLIGDYRESSIRNHQRLNHYNHKNELSQDMSIDSHDLSRLNTSSTRLYRNKSPNTESFSTETKFNLKSLNQDVNLRRQGRRIKSRRPKENNIP